MLKSVMSTLGSMGNTIASIPPRVAASVLLNAPDLVGAFVAPAMNFPTDTMGVAATGFMAKTATYHLDHFMAQRSPDGAMAHRATAEHVKMGGYVAQLGYALYQSGIECGLWAGIAGSAAIVLASVYNIVGSVRRDNEIRANAAEHEQHQRELSVAHTEPAPLGHADPVSAESQAQEHATGPENEGLIAAAPADNLRRQRSPYGQRLKERMAQDGQDS